MTLHLILTHHWFDEILAGRKRTEYRERSHRLLWRIWGQRDQITRVRFARGYTSNTIEFPVTHIDEGPCPYPQWDGMYYRIHFTDDKEATP